MAEPFKIGDRIRLTGHGWDGPRKNAMATVTVESREWESARAHVDGERDDMYVYVYANPNDIWYAEVVNEKRELKVGDRIVLTGSYWQKTAAYRDGGAATVSEVGGNAPNNVGYFVMESGVGNYLMSDEFIANYPEYAWRLADEWDPKDDHQDSLTFRTGSNRTISVGWGQGTKDTPKVQLSVHGTSVALTHEELEVLALTLVKAKEENERIFKG